MQTLIVLLMVGMIGLVVFFGQGGMVVNLITGTSTADTAYKAFLPVIWGLCLIVILIMKIGRHKWQIKQ